MSEQSVMDETRLKYHAVSAVALLAWQWLAVAAFFFTDAAGNMFVGMALCVAWLVILLRWVEALAPDFRSTGLHSRASVYWWLAAAIPLCVGPLLVITDIWVDRPDLVV